MRQEPTHDIFAVQCAEEMTINVSVSLPNSKGKNVKAEQFGVSAVPANWWLKNKRRPGHDDKYADEHSADNP